MYNAETKYYEGTAGLDSINICAAGGDLCSAASLSTAAWILDQLRIVIFASEISYINLLTGLRYKAIFYAIGFKNDATMLWYEYNKSRLNNDINGLYGSVRHRL